VDARVAYFDPLGLKLLDQLLRIARSFDVEGVVRHSGCALLRGVEEAKTGFTGAQANYFDTADGLLGSHLRP